MSSGHHDASPGAVGRRLALAAAITALVLLLEAAGGILTRSLALLSDAGHVFAPSATTAPRCLRRW
jgi:cobalt-zinc-cadmium efflux system protein